MLISIRKYFLIVCVLFATTTFCSSIIQLIIQGNDFDSNTHILLRAALCFLGTSFLYLFKVIKINNKLIQEIVHYLVSLFLILLFMFCLGFFVEVNEAPPFPIFALNYTGVYIVVSVVIYFERKRKEIIILTSDYEHNPHRRTGSNICSSLPISFLLTPHKDKLTSFRMKVYQLFYSLYN